MRFLIDMNLSPLWVSFLADAGFESLHWSSIGEPSAPDTQIMDYASRHCMIVIHSRS
jgi:predicted nuclease of predicted toxin-antitoxin system